MTVTLTEVRERSAALVALLEELPASSLKPMGDRVLVFPLEDPFERKVGTLIVLDQKEQEASRPWRGTVVKVGPGTIEEGERHPIDLKRGQVVVIGRFVGEPVVSQNVELRLVRAADILARLEDVEASG